MQEDKSLVWLDNRQGMNGEITGKEQINDSDT